ncbi:MAG: hypothetical protein JO189_19995 [Deltaproteobacteria bacterium]|nr:hypothetical protein [Deltaproteobacteria bacterium]
MPTKKQYFVEQTNAGRYALCAKGSRRASGLCDTQEEARALAKNLNPDDHADIEHVRNTKRGVRDKWRSNK